MRRKSKKAKPKNAKPRRVRRAQAVGDYLALSRMSNHGKRVPGKHLSRTTARRMAIQEDV